MTMAATHFVPGWNMSPLSSLTATEQATPTEESLTATEQATVSSPEESEEEEAVLQKKGALLMLHVCGIVF